MCDFTRRWPLERLVSVRTWQKWIWFISSPVVWCWPQAWGGRVSLPRAHLQRRCFDVADVAMGTGTLRTDALEASPHVDASCPTATVVLLAQTLVHIWKTKQWSVTGMRGERPARWPPCSLVTAVTTVGCCDASVYYFKSFEFSQFSLRRILHGLKVSSVGEELRSVVSLAGWVKFGWRTPLREWRCHLGEEHLWGLSPNNAAPWRAVKDCCSSQVAYALIMCLRDGVLSRSGLRFGPAAEEEEQPDHRGFNYRPKLGDINGNCATHRGHTWRVCC